MTTRDRGKLCTLAAGTLAMSRRPAGSRAEHLSCQPFVKKV